jgi:hypothetical protein
MCRVKNSDNEAYRQAEKTRICNLTRIVIQSIVKHSVSKSLENSSQVGDRKASIINDHKMYYINLNINFPYRPNYYFRQFPTNISETQYPSDNDYYDDIIPKT